ncbi:hypothetical protein [Streptomyces sp. NPDC058572]|uniref:hypothetical protein n=1 Tax=Streptomyces sp. NPDC058572 TaxID=3346546 RepID=UPI0036469429
MRISRRQAVCSKSSKRRPKASPVIRSGTSLLGRETGEELAGHLDERLAVEEVPQLAKGFPSVTT